VIGAFKAIEFAFHCAYIDNEFEGLLIPLHQGLQPCIDDDGYMVLELCEGTNLYRYLDSNGPLNEVEVAAVCINICIYVYIYIPCIDDGWCDCIDGKHFC
jgi:serine/threonine protein kinase